MLTAKHISNILDMCNDKCVIIDVSTSREATITRIHDTLLEYTQFDASTIEKVTHNGKCLLIKNTTPSFRTIHLFRRRDSCIVHLPDDGTVDDFIETYFANYDDFVI
jgi:hypothetical protein